MNKTTLDAYLRLWQQGEKNLLEKDGVDEGHLSEAELYGLAESNALEQANEKHLDHLSFCPQCLEQWAKFRKAAAAVEELEEETELVMSFGMAEVAGCDLNFQSQSSCGNFLLELRPGADDNKCTVIVLRYIGSPAEAMEGRCFAVKDADQKLIIEGIINNKVLKEIRDDFSEGDFSTWTIVEK